MYAEADIVLIRCGIILMMVIFRYLDIAPKIKNGG